MFKSRRVWTYYEDEDCEGILEDIDGYIFVHIIIHNYNKTVKKRMMEKWKEILQWANDNEYDGVNCYTKDVKLVSLLTGGGYTVLDTIDSDDNTYEVLRWQV